jgi:hypothetical protein
MVLHQHGDILHGGTQVGRKRVEGFTDELLKVFPRDDEHAATVTLKSPEKADDHNPTVPAYLFGFI